MEKRGSLSIPHNAKQWCFHTYIVLSFLASLTWGRSLMSLQVPQNAQPGHVVTVLPTSRGWDYTLRDPHDGTIAKHFSVMQQGQLITNSDVSHLGGQSVYLFVENMHPLEPWSQMLSLDFSAKPNSLYFEGQPYEGRIVENQLPETPVTGLENLYDSINDFPSSVNMSIVSGDVDDFKIVYSPSSHVGILVSAVEFDRENKSCYHIVLKAEDVNAEAYAIVTIHVEDDNDNAPAFLDTTFFGMIPMNADPMTQIMQVMAHDLDLDDIISYVLEEENDLFHLLQDSGDIFLMDPAALQPQSYELSILAVDDKGAKSEPATVRLEVESPESHQRSRRAVQTEAVFVINITVTFGDLFHVAGLNPIEEEQYAFTELQPMFTIHMDTGMVSLVPGASFEDGVMEYSMEVNITRTDDPTYSEILSVKLVRVSRGIFDPIFVNEPQPITLLVPTWIRPYTPLIELEAIDEVEYGAEVVYNIESGADERFRINSVTGEISTFGRFPYTCSDETAFELAVSANVVGVPSSITTTPAQVVTVYCDLRPPQFYNSPMNFTIDEMMGTDDVVLTIQAKSFFEIAIQYTIMNRDGSTSNDFTIGPSNGEMRARRQLNYAFDPHQYQLTVSAREPASGFSTTEDLTINLKDINNYVPEFPPAMYIALDISEDVSVGTSLVDVFVTDLDSGALGEVTFSVDNELFTMTTNADGKSGTLKTMGQLDYDRLPERKYEVIVTAVDGGDPPNTGTGTVQVWMANVNDEAPVFSPPVQEVWLKKSLTNTDNPVVYVVQFYDLDGDRLTFKFVGGTSATRWGPFELDTNTGAIRLVAPLSEQEQKYYLHINATDTGSCCVNNGAVHETNGTVVIDFADVNRPPKFPLCDQYTPSLPENSEAQTSVLSFQATDDDAGSNGELTYELIVTYPNPEYFGIREVPGTDGLMELYTTEIFDRENPAPGYLKVTGKIAYPVTIRAVDNGRYPLSATCFLLVTIDDVNDYIPEFDDNSYFVGIPFTAGPSSQVMRVYAWDRDEGDNAIVNYKIRSESPNACSGPCFTINQSTGWIYIDNSIPSSNTLLTMVVEAWDPLGSPKLPDVATVNVTVNRTSSQMWLPPQWQQVGNIQIDDFNVTIEEDYPVQEIIAQVFTATSMRPSEDVSYYIQRGLVYELNFDELFVAYQAQPGMQIEVNQALDYEKSSMHILQMRASYYNLDLNLRSLARPQINLIDVNDNRPQWYGVDSDGRFPASIEEDAVFGAYVTTVFAVDQDGTSPNNRVSYYFADECNTDCDQFAINENSGQITKNIEVPFDRTVQSQYTLKVIAMDGDPLVTAAENRRRSTVIAVQVGITGASLNPPEFPSDQYTANIDAGNYIDQLLIQIEADYNLDDGDTYPQYAIISGNDDRLFYVDSNSGQIYIVGTMNYTNGPYILGYRVFDGLKFDETTLTVSVNYVNIYPPQFSMAVYPDVTNIVEGGSQTDIFMVDTHAVDPENTNIVYGLDGQFYLDDTSRFTVNSDGVVWLKQGLDRDYPYGHANWQINVAADDEGGSSSKQRGYAVVNLLLQDINDNAPIFDTCCLIGTILEGPTTGVAGLQVFANDYDAGNNAQVTYSLVNSDEFYIESYTGIIRNSVSLDRETVPQYTVTVRATDGGIPSLTTEAEVIINVGDDNDHAPVFDPTEYVITMPENQPIGSSVTTVYATDADIGYNALLTYEVQPSAYSGYFYMDSIQAAGTGVVKINQVVDYDEAMVRQLSIQIKVSDPKPGNSAVATLSITVTDVNDNAPVIVPSDNTVVINEDAAVGESVAEFSATDIDEGVNAEFEYFINYADSDPYKNFAITTNDQNAVVTVRNALDRELTESFTLEILAIDRGEPPMTGTAILTVLVGDLNEHAPELDLPTYPPVVPRNPGSNQLIAELEVTDRDGPENGPPFTLIPCQSTNPGCSDFNFQLTGANNNVLQVRTRKSSYSRESFSAYSIPVVLKDNPLSGLASKTGTTMLTVIIEDVNDNPHSPSSKTINIFNYKGSYMDIYIGHVYVEDLDDWDRAEKTYEFVLDHSGFELRSFGDIYMVAALPEGTKKLSVRVTDAMFGSVVTEVIVKITWLDDDAVYSSGSLRLTDITAKEFVEATTVNGALVSKFELMRNILGTNLGTAAENVDIFSVRDVPDLERTVDIRYSAHGSPYYRSARLNGIMLNNLEKMQTDLGITIAMVPVDECSLINCFDAGCTNTLITTSEPLLVNTNQTSLVGINSYIEASCTCGARNFSDIGENPQECDALSCLNGGTCEATISGDVKCVCPAGFDGPRCQQLRHSFTGSGWAWYNPLEQCESDILSLEFTTLALNGLILYNGPWPNSADNDDFISIEMQDGYPKVRMDLGDGGVSMTVDGRNSQGVRKLSALNDGAWHTLHIFKEGMELRMIVDYCVSSEITETLNTTSEDRASCEATATVPGDRFVLRLSTPLELGGRSNPNVNYPSGLTSDKFNGCIKNLQHNGILYDLHIGNVGEDLNTQDGCPREDNNCGTIPTNSTCSVGLVTPPFGSTYWTCNPGYTGQNCDIESTVKNMETSQSFMEWYMNSAYNSTLSSDYNSLQLMFRTRQENGLVFSSGSFSTLERLRIEIVDSYLQLRYDLGSDDMFLSLPYVNVSDGLWHTVYVYRHGNQVVLKLDGGEGRYFAEAAPVEAHRTIVLGNESFAGADVIYRRFWSDPEIKDSFQDSCIKDIRYNSLEFPMLEEDNSNAVGILLLRDEQTQVNCNSSGCFGVTCLSPLVCIDAWRLGVCLCPVGMFPVDTAELCVDACLNHQCSYGVCIATSATSYRCDCEDGYSGDLCNQAAVVAVALATNALIAIIISLLLLLLLIILIFVIFRYRRKDPLLLEVDPEDDIRDNVVNYEEEGAGEEDMLAFDITRLQKPVDPDADSMGPDKPMRRDMMPPLGRAPEGMPPNYPSMGPDGKHPNIGDFIDDRMGDADDDPNAPPYDSVREYQYEGSGSQAGSLSSLNSSSTDGDQDYDYLNNWGPQFSKLADLYAGGNDEDDDTSSV